MVDFSLPQHTGISFWHLTLTRSSSVRCSDSPLPVGTIGETLAPCYLQEQCEVLMAFMKIRAAPCLAQSLG